MVAKQSRYLEAIHCPVNRLPQRGLQSIPDMVQWSRLTTSVYSHISPMYTGLVDELRARHLQASDIHGEFMQPLHDLRALVVSVFLTGPYLSMNLAQESDIVLENLAPGSMQRLGLGYDAVSQANPGIIYCSISGYGQTRPYASKPADDPQIQGMSGLMDINGDPGGPPTKVGFYIGDLVTPILRPTPSWRHCGTRTRPVRANIWMSQ